MHFLIFEDVLSQYIFLLCNKIMDVIIVYTIDKYSLVIMEDDNMSIAIVIMLFDHRDEMQTEYIKK